MRPDRLQSFAILGVTIAALGAISAANEIVQYFLVIIALLSFLGFMWALGGYPCKERLYGAWRVCKRCLGFYIGMSMSVIIVLVLKWTYGIPIVSRPYALVLLLVGMACSLPTMIHGGRRRLRPHDEDHTAFLMFSGFLVGIGCIICFLALNSVLKVR